MFLALISNYFTFLKKLFYLNEYRYLHRVIWRKIASICRIFCFKSAIVFAKLLVSL